MSSIMALAPKCGRPPPEEPIMKIVLRRSTYEKWVKMKSAAGFGDKTNNEFAENLLRSYEMLVG